MRLKTILVLAPFGFMVIGGYKTYIFATNRTPKNYSVETYLKDKPSGRWVQLTGGKIDLKEATYLSTLGVGPISEVYLPLRPAESKGDGELQILVKTKNPEILSFVSDLRAAKSEADGVRVIEEHTKAVAPLIFKDVQGLVSDGADLHIIEILKLKSVYPKLPEHFTVLAEGEKPDPADVAMFGVGVVLSSLIVIYLFRRKTPTAPGGPPPIPPPIPPIPPASAGPPPIPSY